MSRGYDSATRKRFPIDRHVSTPGHLGCLAIQVAVLEAQHDDGVFPHTYSACPEARESMIFPVSRNGGAMSGMPKAATAATNWRDWVIKVENGRAVSHPAANWGNRLEVSGRTCNEVLPCGHYVFKIKDGWAGNGHPPH